jgi:hypothetical protein
MLHRLALRTTGQLVGALMRWQARHGWKRDRRRALPHERQQLETAQARSREVVQRRADAFVATVLSIVEQIRQSGATTLRAIAAALNAEASTPRVAGSGTTVRCGISWHGHDKRHPQRADGVVWRVVTLAERRAAAICATGFIRRIPCGRDPGVRGRRSDAVGRRTDGTRMVSGR